jgi:hypothetical protein
MTPIAWNQGVRLMTVAVPRRVVNSSSLPIVEDRQRARRPAGRLQHVGDDVAVRELDALADAGRAAGVGQVREVDGRVDDRVQVPVSGIGREQFGRVDVAVLELQARGEVERVPLAGDDDGLHPGRGQCAADERQHLVPGDQHGRPGVGELGREVGGRQQRVRRRERRAGQQDAVVERRVLPAVRDVDGDDVAAADAVIGQPAGDGVGAGTQLGEGQRDVVVDERGPVTPAPHRRPPDRPDRDRRVLQ